MHLKTNLADIRGKRTVAEIAAASGVSEAIVRQIEQGKLMPRDHHIEALEAAYGVVWVNWYSRLALAAIQEGDQVG